MLSLPPAALAASTIAWQAFSGSGFAINNSVIVCSMKN